MEVQSPELTQPQGLVAIVESQLGIRRRYISLNLNIHPKQTWSMKLKPQTIPLPACT